ncbi:MAG: hypothetical protein ACLP8Y_00460, partial [Thermoplasmata archaeon]
MSTSLDPDAAERPPRLGRSSARPGRPPAEGAPSAEYPNTPGVPPSSPRMTALPDKKTAFIDWYLAVVD